MLINSPSLNPNQALKTQAFHSEGSVTQVSPEPRDVRGSSVASLPEGEASFHALGRRFQSGHGKRSHKQSQAQDVHQNSQGEFVSTFPGRNGYDTNFLGKSLPFPSVDASVRDQLAERLDKPGETRLDYTNFSIVMNKERRQPMITAVNIDGSKIVDVRRDGDWTIDGRIAREHQLGNEAYRSNPIDRGHMVRRRDAAWGDDAVQGSRDTFVFTNAGLQHGSLNQKIWLDLENHVLDQARQKDQKLTVLTGPVFSPDDPTFNNRGRMDKPTQMPKEFWKVVVWNDGEEGLKGAAFIQSQKDYIGRGMFKADFDPGSMSVYQMPIKDLEKITKINFGEIADSTSETRALRDAEQARL